jgi:hypothetical protein
MVTHTLQTVLQSAIFGALSSIVSFFGLLIIRQVVLNHRDGI